MKEKTKTEIAFRFGVLNIKVAPKTESIDSNEYYISIFKRIFDNDIACNTRGEKFMEFRSMNKTDDNKVVFGKLMYYTVLNPDDWYNRKSKTLQSVNIDSFLYPNAIEGDFYFIPEAHRFCFVLKSNGIAISQVEKFLNQAISKVISDKQTVFISQELTEDFIERIIKAESLSKLCVDISYTNNDLTDDFDKILDNDLRDGQVKNLHLEAKSFSKETINLERSKVLSAALKLSQSNGYAEATIKEEGKNIVVSTSEYPRIEHLFTKLGREHLDVYQRIIKLFRNDRQN